MTRTTIAVLAAALLTTAAPLAAQQTTGARASSTKGFFLGLHGNSSTVESDEQDGQGIGTGDERGSGLGLQLGYGFTHNLALVLDGTGALLDLDGEDVGLGHFDIGLRYAFTGPTRPVVPYLEAAFSGYGLGQNDADFGDGTTGDVTLTGTGFTFGGGLQYYVAPKWALGAAFKYTTGEFDKVKVDDVSVDDLNIDATTTRINLGVTWYPGGGR